MKQPSRLGIEMFVENQSRIYDESTDRFSRKVCPGGNIPTKPSEDTQVRFDSANRQGQRCGHENDRAIVVPRLCGLTCDVMLHEEQSRNAAGISRQKHYLCSEHKVGQQIARKAKAWSRNRNSVGAFDDSVNTPL
jgi:hypothetical protein